MQERQLKEEREKRIEQWNSFVDFGILLPDVNPIIAQSWVRSKALEVNPYNPSVFHLSDDELEKLRRENRDMIRFAQPLMDKLLSLVKDSVNAMSLHDKNGYMLAIAHHDTPKGSWRESIFRPGVRWAEEDVGTNGVGLTLKLGKPVQIFGAEHYCYMQRDISCSAAPIHSADGELIGALNVSGPFWVWTIIFLRWWHMERIPLRVRSICCTPMNSSIKRWMSSLRDCCCSTAVLKSPVAAVMQPVFLR